MKNIKNFQVQEKFLEAVAAYIVHFVCFSKDFEGLENAFRLLDTNGDGKITYKELKNGIDKVYGHTLSEIQIMYIISQVDGDKDGYISYEEFLRSGGSKGKLFQEKNIKLLFKDLDKNNDGKLSYEELKVLFSNLENKYIKKLIEKMDQNKDGSIDYDEFMQLLKAIMKKNRLDKSNINNLKKSVSI